MREPCPRCSADHLHVSVLVEADTMGSRFVATNFATEGDSVVVQRNEKGRLVPEVAFVSCCACDWFDERPIRLSGD